MYNAIYRSARRASLFFLFCLLAALAGLPFRGALATSAHENRPVSNLVQEEQYTVAVISQALTGIRPAAPAMAAPVQSASKPKTVS